MTLPDAALVEIAAPDASPELATVMVDACMRASSMRCAMGTKEGSATIGVVSVVIEIADGGATAKIELRAGASRASTRTLRFRPEDEQHERWRTIGLVAGSAAEGFLSQPATRWSIDRRAEGKTVRPPAKSDAQPPLRIDALVLVGSALDDGSVRVGPNVRVGYVFPRLPLLIATSFRYGVRPADDAGLSVHWIGGTVGLGVDVPLGLPAFRLDARAELVAELMLATVTEPFTEASDTTSRWVGGGRLGAHLVYMFGSRIGLVAGTDATLVQSGTVVKIREDSSGRAPPYSFAGGAGLRIALP